MYTCVVGDQKNRLIEAVLLITHNICFGYAIYETTTPYDSTPVTATAGIFLFCFIVIAVPSV